MAMFEKLLEYATDGLEYAQAKLDGRTDAPGVDIPKPKRES